MGHIATYFISFLFIAGVIIRSYKIPEAIWAVSGAVVLIVCRLLLPSEGLAAIAKGTDVYLFLTGMMLLAETAREEKLFDWLAAYATRLSNGSSNKLFLLIYLVGVIVTTLLSNDATAVVLTPAVAAATKAAKVKNSLPYLFICAFVANAASFVLPISNPANLVIYGSRMPSLTVWLPKYILPSLAAVIVTFILLFLTQRKALKQPVQTNISLPVLSKGGKVALLGIAATALVLLVSSAFDIQLGLPTAVTGILTSAIVIVSAKKNPLVIVKGVSWSVLPLVAGLFVIAAALNKTGLTETLLAILQHGIQHSVTGAIWASGFTVAFCCNLLNNLPAGLIAGNVLQAGHMPELVKSAVLIGIDLGPNLSVTGSLATILWLVALRREKIIVTSWHFLKLGFLIMTIALFFAIAALFL